MAPPPAPPPLLPDPDRVVRLSYFDTLTDTRPKVRDVRVDALIAALSRHDERRRKTARSSPPPSTRRRPPGATPRWSASIWPSSSTTGRHPTGSGWRPTATSPTAPSTTRWVDADHPRGAAGAARPLPDPPRPGQGLERHLGSDPPAPDSGLRPGLPATSPGCSTSPPAPPRVTGPPSRRCATTPGRFLDPRAAPAVAPARPRPVRPVAPRPPGTPRRPGDDFAQRGDYGAYLETAGWTFLWERGGVAYWKRPGQTPGDLRHVQPQRLPQPPRLHVQRAAVPSTRLVQPAGDRGRAGARGRPEEGRPGPRAGGLRRSLTRTRSAPEGKDGGLEAFAEADVARPAPGAPPRRSGAGARRSRGRHGPPDDGAPPPGSGDAPRPRGEPGGLPWPRRRTGSSPGGSRCPWRPGPGAADLPAWPGGVLPEALQAYAEGVAGPTRCRSTWSR